MVLNQPLGFGSKPFPSDGFFDFRGGDVQNWCFQNGMACMYILCLKPRNFKKKNLTDFFEKT